MNVSINRPLLHASGDTLIALLGLPKAESAITVGLKDGSIVAASRGQAEHEAAFRSNRKVKAALDALGTSTHAPVIPATVVKAAAPARTPKAKAAPKPEPVQVDKAVANQVWKAAFDLGPDKFRRRAASRAQAALYAGSSKADAILIGVQYAENLAVEAAEALVNA